MLANKQKRQFEKEIYYRYADYMFTVCFRYIGNREIAEEILNNGFLKAFMHYGKFEKRHENSLKSWIKKIIINECLMYLRKKNEFELIDIESVCENNFSQEWAFPDENELIRIIQKLPIGYRTVFNLFAIEGYSHNEISKHLGIKESTSRSQLTMARKLLKEHLIKIGYEAADK
jgi:RNA polymerase sigma-70 factor, ECF subfamily